MRRSTLTLGLGASALAAVAVAPRLSGWSEPDAIPMAVTPSLELPVEQIAVEVEGPLEAPQVPETRIRRRRPARPASGAIPMKTSARPEETIPELSEPTGAGRVAPPVQPEPLPLGYWDDCPACGMG